MILSRFLKRILPAVLLACLLLLTLAGCKKKSPYSGLWLTYIPSEFGYSYALRPDGSCILGYWSQFGEENYEWKVGDCRWSEEKDRLVLSFKGERTYGITTGYTETGQETELFREAIDFPPITMTYTIDEDYINEYLDYPNCRYNITGTFAMVPEKTGNCREEWCGFPAFRVKGDNPVSIFKHMENFKCIKTDVQ